METNGTHINTLCLAQRYAVAAYRGVRDTVIARTMQTEVCTHSISVTVAVVVLVGVCEIYRERVSGVCLCLDVSFCLF